MTALVYQHRSPTSATAAGAVFAALAFGGGLHLANEWKPTADEAPVEVSLYQEQQPVPEQVRPPEPRRIQTSAPTQPSLRRAESLVENPLAPPAPAVSEPPKPASAPPVPVPEPVRQNVAATAEQAYIAKVRANVLARKKYPTGREVSLLRPAGKVRAWVVLDRWGAVRDRGIETSSNSIILDNAALRLLGSGEYPPFPEQAFVGQDSHRIYFDLDYQPGEAG